MGCDGGTIPRRDELVRTKKKPEQKDKAAELAFRWNCCAISQNPLQKPVVACGLGRLYSKMSILEALLEKKNIPEVAQHIKTLKDVKDLTLTPNPAYKPESIEKGDSFGDPGTSPYICPMIGLEMNGRFGFVFLWSCGCVLSERALKEVKSTVCHKCQKSFKEEDIVVLNPSGDELDRAVVRMEARRAREKAEKGKKRKHIPNGEEESSSSEAGPSKLPMHIKKEPIDNGEYSGGKQKPLEEPVTVKTDSSKSSINLNGQKRVDHPITVKTESSKALVNSNGHSKSSGSKILPSKGINGASSSSSSSALLRDPEMKKMTNGYSISKDPKASEVYKSLFTTHEKARQQTKAHWVTYNPFYN